MCVCLDGDFCDMWRGGGFNTRYVHSEIDIRHRDEVDKKLSIYYSDASAVQGNSRSISLVEWASN